MTHIYLRKLKFLAFIVLINVITSSSAWSQFQLNNNATQLGADYYRLTNPTNSQSGSIWFNYKTDLRKDFDLTVDLNFGNKNSGADGIVFAFQNYCASAGTIGGGIGYEGITPSVGVEFDTYQNTSRNDPANDHTCIFKNGVIDHNSSSALSPTVNASSTSTNIEDNQDHEVRIFWNSSTQTLESYFNGVLRVSYSGNLVDSIFNGDPYVYWGFTAATGGFNNRHAVRVISYPDNIAQLQDSTICDGDSLELFVPSGSSYRWTPTTYISDTTSNKPFVFPPVTTTYTVEIEDACNTILYDTVTITVNPKPGPPTASSNNPVCDGSNLQLASSAPPGISQWNWNGPNSFTSTAQNPAISSVTPSATGNYLLQGFDGNCWSNPDTIAVNVITIETPSAGSNSPICEGGTLSLTASSSNATSYSWTGPNGYSSSLQNTTRNNVQWPLDTGSYQVLAHGQGCTSTPTSINAQITPIIGAGTSNSPICEGAALNLSADPVPGASYSWTGPNSFSSTQQNPTISNTTTLNAGTYTLVTSNGSCTPDTSVVTVTIYPAVNAPTLNSNSPICEGDTLAITASNESNIDTYFWSGPNSFTSSLQNPTITGTTVANQGSYGLIVSSPDGCTDTSTNISVVIHATPTVSISANPSNFCPGTDTVMLTASPSAAGTYAWKHEGNPVGNSGDFFYATQAGNYTVNLTDINGCSATSSSLNIGAGSNPVALLAADKSDFCPGETVTFTVPFEANGLFEWFRNGSSLGTPTSNDSTLITSIEGNYSVEIVSSFGCQSNSNIVGITEKPSPLASIVTPNTTLCGGDSIIVSSVFISGARYEWFLNSSSLGPAIINDYHLAATAAGDYYVVVTDQCSTTSNPVTISSGIPPANAGSINGTDVFCPGAVETYSISNVSGATDYEWEVIPSNGGIIASGQGTTSAIIHLRDQNVQIKVTPSNNCGDGNSSTKAVNINPGFGACFAKVMFAGDQSGVCTGSSVTFTNFTNSGDFFGASPRWNFGPNASPSTSTANNPVVTYNAPGSYDVTLEYVDDFSMAVVAGETKQNYITASDKPNTSVITGNENPVCQGVNEMYSVINSVGSTYQWSVPSGSQIVSSTKSSNIMINFATQSGTIQVIETNQSGCSGDPVSLNINLPAGCGATDSIAPTLVQNTGATVVQGQSTSLTNGELQFTDNLAGPDEVIYLIASGPSFGYLQLSTNPGVAISSFSQLDIDNGRISYVHNGGSTGNDAFSFSVSDGNNSTSSTSFSINVDSPTGFGNEQNEVWVSPNPCNQHIRVRLSVPEAKYELFSATGSVTKYGQITADGLIHVSEIPNGIYFLRIRFDDDQRIIRILKR